MSKLDLSRRGVLKTGAVAGAGLALPTIFTSGASAFTNEPGDSSVTLGFNVPQSGPYADEGADELRAYFLAVEHLNGEGDGGMLNTFSSKALDGSGILGRKVEYVTGDTQTKSDAARASARSMIEKDGAIMITGGSSSGVAVAVHQQYRPDANLLKLGTSFNLTDLGTNPNIILPDGFEDGDTLNQGEFDVEFGETQKGFMPKTKLYYPIDHSVVDGKDVITWSNPIELEFSYKSFIRL